MRRPKVALFDLDGVLIDTESQYTAFWEQVGTVAFPSVPDFAERIKGQALEKIFSLYFAGQPAEVEKVRAALDSFEAEMKYVPIAGACNFVKALREERVRTAVVTSSNRRKMANLYRALPLITADFDRIFTAEDAGRSKPAPDCYLNAMRYFEVSPEETVVFEDSENGLKAAVASGAKVVGLSTSLPVEKVKSFTDCVISDFSSVMSVDLWRKLFSDGIEVDE